MADTKISLMPTLGQADVVATTDVVPVVTIGPPNVNKKVTPQALVGASVSNLTQTWNDAGTVFSAVKMNVTDSASNASSTLLDLQVGGASQFKVSKAGVTSVGSTLELGHASDTTLSRSSAGVLAVEGIVVPTVSSTNTLSNKTLASPTITGTISGTPTWGSPQQFSTIELGSGTDTTLSRASAGILAVEGVAVPTISSSDTLSNKTLSSPIVSGTIAGAATWSGTQTFGVGTGAPVVRIDGGNSTNNGAILVGRAAGVDQWAVGSYSGIIGGAYDPDFTIYNAINSGKAYIYDAGNKRQIVTTTASETLSNKTLSSPTLSGTVAGSPTFTGALVMTGTPRLVNFNIGADSDIYVYESATNTLTFRAGGSGTETYLTIKPSNVLELGGVAVPTISSSDTLSNKTLSSPTVSGTVAGSATWSGAQTFGVGGASGTATYLYINGTAAGTGGGSALWINNNGTIKGGIGSWSAFSGGTYDSDLTLYSPTGTYYCHEAGIKRQIATDANVMTLSNKTLSSPTLSGTVAGNASWSGAQTFAPNTSVGAGSGQVYSFINGGNSGTNGGAALVVQLGSSTNIAIGNKSSILGGAFDAVSLYYNAATTEFYASGNPVWSYTTSGIFVGGVAVPTISSTSTLTNKTLSSPTLSGTTTCGAINVSAASVAATINSTNNVYVLGISYASTTGGYIGTTSAGNLRLTDSTLTTMLDVNTAKVVTTGTLQANKSTSAASPDTSSNSITNVIFRVSGSNVGAAGYGIDMGVSNSDGTSWIQSRDHNNYATNTTLRLNPNGGGATLGGVAIPTISSTDTLSNKTLSSPTLSGTVSAAGGVTVSQGTFNYFQVTDVAATSGQTGYRINVKDSGGVNRDTYLYGVGASANLLLPASGTFYISAASGSAGLQLNSVAIPTISSTDTLSNKTISSPTLSGTVAGTPTFSGTTTFQNYNLVIQTTSATGTSGLRFRQSDGVHRWDWGFNDNDDSIFLNRFNSSGSYQDTPIAVDNTGAVNFKGVAVPTISSTDTLSNKTLSSPTLSGTVAGNATWSGYQTFQATATFGTVFDEAIRLQNDGGYISFYNDAGTTRRGYIYNGGTYLSLVNEITNGDWAISTNGTGTLRLNSVAVPTISSTDTLTNKTLSSPTISGTIAGNVTASGTWNFSSASTGAIVTITSTDAGAAAHSLDFFRNSASPAASDVVGQIRFLGKNASGTTINYARADSYITDPTAGSEDATFRISNYIAGSQVDTFVISDVATFYVSVAHADATNISVGTTTGTKIGTATNQKLGFFNKTPVVQPTAVADATDAASVITQLNALLSRMRDLGLIAT